MGDLGHEVRSLLSPGGPKTSRQSVFLWEQGIPNRKGKCPCPSADEFLALLLILGVEMDALTVAGDAR